MKQERPIYLKARLGSIRPPFFFDWILFLGTGLSVLLFFLSFHQAAAMTNAITLLAMAVTRLAAVLRS